MKLYNNLELLEPRRLLSSNIVADFGGIYPTESVTLNGISYFAANDGRHGSELWKSDGTPGGTVFLKDIFKGATGSSPRDFHVVEDRVLFFARATDTAYHLFSTDGTTAGTVSLAVASIPRGAHDLSSMINGKVLYTVANMIGNSLDIWSTDGTPEGTQVVKNYPDFFATTHGSRSHSYSVGDRVVFDVLGDIIGTDGTPDGTQLISSGADGYFVENLAAANNSLFFLRYDWPDIGDNAPSELWKTDGTLEGTTLVRSMPTGMRSDISAAGDRLYFERAAYHGGTDYEYSLWTSEGTTDGTYLVSPTIDAFASDSTISLPNGFILIFQGTGDADMPTVLVGSDGTSATSLPIAAPFGPIATQVIGNTVFMLVSPETDQGAVELWKTDGLAKNTVKVANVGQWDTDYPEWNYKLGTTFDGKLIIQTPHLTSTFDPATMSSPIGVAQNKLSLDAGVLRIFGTANSDLIKLYDVNGNPDRFIVNLNGVTKSFAFADISRIWIYGYAGNDNIAVNEKLGKFAARCRIWAGDGNDTIWSAEGRDTIYGEAGDDSLFGANNNDMISGGAGDDTLVGGNGDDSVTGDNGADSIQGNKGNDLLSGGNDNFQDKIDAGAGADVLFGQAVYDVFFHPKLSADDPADYLLQN